MKKNIQLLSAVALGLAFGCRSFWPGEVQLAKDGKALADIVIAADADRATKFAALDLKYHLDRITGGDFAILADTNAPTGRYEIRVGFSSRTKADASAFIEQDFLVDVGADAMELVGIDAAGKGEVELVFSGTERERQEKLRGQPGYYDPQGSMYAVYEFLENELGVRWLDVSDDGTVMPHDPNLSVRRMSRKARPYFTFRGGTPDYCINEWFEREDTPEWWQVADLAWDHRGDRDYARRRQRLYLLRHRYGGEQAEANHSFYGWIKRFYPAKRPTDNPEAAARWEGHHPEYFGKGVGTSQLCYSSDAVVSQAVVDARAYFDHGGYPNYNGKGEFTGYTAKWGKNTFCLTPMDNSSFCRCEKCTSLYETNRPNDEIHSTCFFTFVKRVAEEVKKTHPTKRISALAYWTYQGLPTGVKLPDNVLIHYCYDQNRMPYQTERTAEQRARIAEWRKAYPDQPMALWLYNTFPLEHFQFWCMRGVPGFAFDWCGQDYRFFHDNGVAFGIFQCGMNGSLDCYGQLEWMVDPLKDSGEMKRDWFGSFGKAGVPLRKFYETLERRYCVDGICPRGLHVKDNDLNWRRICPPEVVTELAGLMAEAERLAETPREKRRVAVWRESVWHYLQRGAAADALRPTVKATGGKARVDGSQFFFERTDEGEGVGSAEVDFVLPEGWKDAVVCLPWMPKDLCAGKLSDCKVSCLAVYSPSLKHGLLITSEPRFGGKDIGFSIKPGSIHLDFPRKGETFKAAKGKRMDIWFIWNDLEAENLAEFQKKLCELAPKRFWRARPRVKKLRPDRQPVVQDEAWKAAFRKAADALMAKKELAGLEPAVLAFAGKTFNDGKMRERALLAVNAYGEPKDLTEVAEQVISLGLVSNNGGGMEVPRRANALAPRMMFAGTEIPYRDLVAEALRVAAWRCNDAGSREAARVLAIEQTPEAPGRDTASRKLLDAFVDIDARSEFAR